MNWFHSLPDIVLQHLQIDHFQANGDNMAYLLVLLLHSIFVLAIANSNISATWQNASCNQPTIANPAALHSTRWAAADTDNAWKAVLAAWNNHTTPTNEVSLPFSEFVSSFFRGPEGWNCQNIEDIACSITIECDQAKHPAGFVSFSHINKPA